MELEEHHRKQELSLECEEAVEPELLRQEEELEGPEHKDQADATGASGGSLGSRRPVSWG